MNTRTSLSLLFAATFSLVGCAVEGQDPTTLDGELDEVAAPTDELAAPAGDAIADEGADESGEVTIMQNPAPFDLRCLWAGENYASRAPNVHAAEAIRMACRIQSALIPYKAPGMYPLQLRLPTVSEGVDCSGLTSNAWYRATSGWVRLPHSAAMQESQLRDIPFSQKLPGDLIFYVSSGAASGRHVAMYLGDNLMIEAASSTKGVVVSPVRTTNFSSVGRIW